MAKTFVMSAKTIAAHRYATVSIIAITVTILMAITVTVDDIEIMSMLLPQQQLTHNEFSLQMVYAASGDDDSAPPATVISPHSIYTVRTGIEVADSLLEQGDTDGATYAVEYASEQVALGLMPLREIDSGITDELHLALLDAKVAMSDRSPEQNRDTVNAILTDINRLHAKKTQDLAAAPEGAKNDAIRSMIVDILTEADYLYVEAGEGAAENEAAYQMARSLFVYSSDIFRDNSDPTVMLDLEQRSFFRDLTDIIDERKSFVSVGILVGAIQRDLLGTPITMARDHLAYFANIRVLYDQMRAALAERDYTNAQELSIEAYLENFEYLEPTLEAIDAEFMYALEIEMRENLIGMIKEERPASNILELLDEVILPDLERGEAMTLEYLGTIETAEEYNVAMAASNTPTRSMGDTTASEQSEVRNEIDFIRDSLQDVVLLYEAEDYESAYVTARTAYLDSYEYVEIPLRPIAPDFTLEVEYLFAELRSSIKERAPLEEIRSYVIELDRNLDESERLVTGTGQVAPLIAFSASFAIIFREGLEAVLILGAIMTYLEASRSNKFKPYVHYGVIAAIGATAVTWFVASYVIEISGASRELIEAIAALSATGVLFYVSFWILNKIEHRKWMEFIKAKVWQATTTGSVMVFVMLSFFTVYREGFETVLFYQAMFGFAKYMEMYVGLGFVLGIASLLAIYFVMRMMGKRLPLRVLFGLTMGIGAYLSIAFLGNAIRELQVLDIVPYTGMIGTIPRLDINMATMTGIYPTLETVIGQIVMLGIYVVASVYVLVLRPKKEQAIAAMRKSHRRSDSNH